MDSTIFLNTREYLVMRTGNTGRCSSTKVAIVTYLPLVGPHYKMAKKEQKLLQKTNGTF